MKRVWYKLEQGNAIWWVSIWCLGNPLVRIPWKAILVFCPADVPIYSCNSLKMPATILPYEHWMSMLYKTLCYS